MGELVNQPLAACLHGSYETVHMDLYQEDVGRRNSAVALIPTCERFHWEAVELCRITLGRWGAQSVYQLVLELPLVNLSSHGGNSYKGLWYSSRAC